MISLSKYEIENKHKGQDLGSVGGGAWGVLTISDIKKTQPQCMPYALARYRAGGLGAYVLFSLSLRYLSPLCLNWNFKIKKLAK